MPANHSPQICNQLLEELPRKERNGILARCETVDLEFGTVLCDADEPYRHVYFPLTSFISVVANVRNHPPFELNLIGFEGMLGGTLALGVNNAASRGVVQGAGAALKMSAPQFRRELRDTPSLLPTLNRYLYVLLAQLSQTAVCARFHPIEARLARWLLMAHDRAHADHFHLTQTFLAEMLGVQRSAVTIAAGELQRSGLIRYRRGEIEILSRKSLELASCECYAAVVADYAQLFPHNPFASLAVVRHAGR